LLDQKKHMKGKVVCHFMGGPQGDEELTLPSMHCRERLSLEQDGWIKASADGGGIIVKGRRPDGANWLSYTTAVYEKSLQTHGRGLVYQFVRLETVERCSRVLEAEGRRCKHEALPSQYFCRQHLPGK
jgi:hypothetical protein